MKRYRFRCDVCGVYVYDQGKGDEALGIDAGTRPEDFPDDWKCPICGADKSHLKRTGNGEEKEEKAEEKVEEGYLSEWERNSDDLEEHMKDIHLMSKTGESLHEPMRTRKPVISWDDILVKGAQLAKMPLNKEERVRTKTVIGPKAKVPLVIEMPVYITHMSFGALSREAKLSLSRGSASAKTAMCSGEGGILKESMDSAYKYIFEYVPNRYSLTDDNLKKADAVEIKIGQSAKPGMGGHLPGDKVTKEISEIRGFPEGTDITSPARFGDIKNREDLKRKVEWLREKSGGKPIGIKIAAGNIEKDMEIAVYARPDFITVDGRAGATGSSPKFVKQATSVPTIYALYRARRFLNSRDIRDISLVITGGLRISPDFAKALAMGADAVAIGTSALMAIGCQQYRVCNTGRCPMGVTTHDPELRKRMDVEKSAKRLKNFLIATRSELEDFARLTGNDDVHKLNIDDIFTTNSEISDYTGIEHAGSKKTDGFERIELNEKNDQNMQTLEAKEEDKMSTEDNLKEAFSGESQANRRYLAFAKKADEEGFRQIARLFRAAAEAETVHAHSHLRSLKGINSTRENLQEAIEGETYEFKEMYPGMIETAKKEGNTDALRSFSFANRVEQTHANLYQKALEALKAGKDMEEKKMMVCPVCGHTVEGDAPDECPVCGTPGERFMDIR